MRRFEIAPARLLGWLDRFVASHDGLATVDTGSSVVRVVAGDGAVAECAVPFPPLAVDPARPYGGLVDHAFRERRFGLLLVRRGGWAVGVAEGDRLVASKVGRRYVQSRTAAGGSSQQRFARRRQGQAAELVSDAADAAVAILSPTLRTLDAMVTGGDRLLLKSLLADRRLERVTPLVVDRLLDVRDPRRAVLEQAVTRARAVWITVHDPLAVR